MRDFLPPLPHDQRQRMVFWAIMGVLFSEVLWFAAS